MTFNVALSDFSRVSALGTNITSHLIFPRYAVNIFSEGAATVLTIPELALLAIFTRYTLSQGSIYPFEIVGLVISSLTVLLLPTLCVVSFLRALVKVKEMIRVLTYLCVLRIFGPHILPSSPIFLPIFEIPLLGEYLNLRCQVIC